MHPTCSHQQQMPVLQARNLNCHTGGTRRCCRRESIKRRAAARGVCQQQAHLLLGGGIPGREAVQLQVSCNLAVRLVRHVLCGCSRLRWPVQPCWRHFALSVWVVEDTLELQVARAVAGYLQSIPCAGWGKWVSRHLVGSL